MTVKELIELLSNQPGDYEVAVRTIDEDIGESLTGRPSTRTRRESWSKRFGSYGRGSGTVAGRADDPRHRLPALRRGSFYVL